MTEGSYRSMSYGELSGSFDRLADEAKLFRPLVNVPDDAHPDKTEDPIYLAAIGPELVSTSQVLVPVSVLPVWDVNGYYRAIGVPWPFKVSRRELAASYNALGGPNNHDDYATFAFQRLRDDEFRAHYDRRPLGSPIDDKYRWSEVFRLASRMASNLSGRTDQVVTPKDLLGKDIIDRIEAEATDEVSARAEVAAEDSADVLKPDEPFFWPYAYYLWGSRTHDDERLAQWQQLLVESFARRGLSLQMAVGYVGQTRRAAARVRHRKADGQFVEILFLHEEVVPSPELADVVVGTYHNRPYGTPLEHPLYLHDR